MSVPRIPLCFELLLVRPLSLCLRFEFLAGVRREKSKRWFCWVELWCNKVYEHMCLYRRLNENVGD